MVQIKKVVGAGITIIFSYKTLTAARLNQITAELPEELIVFKPENKWSIKEHIGHLHDLEDLHCGRIHDFILRKEILRAADLKNTKTEKANHNKKELAVLVNNFSDKRKKLIELLEKLDDEIQTFRILHPRLQLKIRPVDIAFFTAEHDDHHIAAIYDLIKYR